MKTDISANDLSNFDNNKRTKKKKGPIKRINN